MDWGAFFNGFAPGGNQGVQQRAANIDATRAETQMRKQQAAQQDEAFNASVLHGLMDEGALPVGPGGVVRRTAYNPGNPNLGTMATGDIPGMPALPAGVGPTNGTYLDKADPSRVVTHKSPDGQVFQFELPTQADRDNKTLWRTLTQQMDPAHRQATQFQNQNVQSAARAKSAGEWGGRYDADAQRRVDEGIPLPDAINDYLPGMGGRKVLPSEADDIIRSAGSYADLTSKAGNRGKPKVVKSELSRDDQGNQVQINTNDDGTVTEVPIKAKGVTTKAPNGVTPYQKWQMDRENNNDSVQRVKTWQDKVDKLQSQSEALWAQKQAADDEVESINQQLNAKTPGILGTGFDASPALKGAERFKLQTRLNDLKRKSTQAAQSATSIDSQKRTADTVRRSLMKANGWDGDSGAGAPVNAPMGTPAGAAPAPPQAANAPAAAAPQQAAAPQGRAPKSATRAQVQAYAQRYKMSEQEAMDAFKKDGIAVR